MVVERQLVVDLNKPISERKSTDVLICGDYQAHTYHLRVERGGEPYTVTGSAKGYFIRQDGEAVLLDGTVEDNVVSVTLAQACYALPGWSRLIIRVADGNSALTIMDMTISVKPGEGDEIIDPGELVPDLTQLLEKIAVMERATAEAERAAAEADTAAANIDGKISAAIAPVDADVAAIKSDLAPLIECNILNPTFVIGTTSSTDGQNADNPARLRSGFCTYSSTDLECPDEMIGWLSSAACYRADKSYISNTAWMQVNRWTTAPHKDKAAVRYAIPSDTAYVRFLFRKSDNSNFIDAERILAHGCAYPNPTGVAEKIAEIEKNAKDITEASVKVASLTGVDCGVSSINQIARLGWLPYAGGYPPEQSIASYAEAYRHGIRWMLCDIQRTSDGQLVCWHDDTINEKARNSDGSIISGQVLVKGSTLSQLDTYDFGIFKGQQYAGLKILRLNEFLKFCADMKCYAVLETKIWLSEAEVRSICMTTRRYGLQDRCVFAEMYDRADVTFPIVRELLPNAPIALRGGSYSAGAYDKAISYGAPDKTTIIGISTGEFELTDAVLNDLVNANVSLWYSEIQSEADMAAYKTAHPAAYEAMRFWSSSYIDVSAYYRKQYGVE